MNFTTKIKEAMVLLHEACKMNDEWIHCIECPFKDYCDTLEETGFGTPDEDEFIE